ncbi:hypothetical protein M011DRAFT_454725 [Sporormia fimetaria CBS 119925]|uniref:Uncharacterized protein n=1 Tax=Sporormia fimetaria CBS 119925 TaxID=1340428 RepID=A0A6A6VML7_9PLEO|nr:hypothetical protein M011DRAFT_454725 [Sporormia fimetaria CBS 119925]
MASREGDKERNTNMKGRSTDQVVVSERSKKFFEQKWKWDHEGFTDDKGVYHTWGMGPESCPPTPGHGLLDNEDENSNCFELASPKHGKNELAAIKEVPRQEAPHVELEQRLEAKWEAERPEATDFPGLPKDFSDLFGTTRLLEQESQQRAADGESAHLPNTIRRRDLFGEIDGVDAHNLRARLEGLLISEWHHSGRLSWEEAYRKVGVDYPDEIIRTAVHRCDTPGKGSRSLSPNEAIGPTTADAPKLSEQIPPGTDSHFSWSSGMSDVSDPPSVIKTPDGSSPRNKEDQISEKQKGKDCDVQVATMQHELTEEKPEEHDHKGEEPEVTERRTRSYRQKGDNIVKKAMEKKTKGVAKVVKKTKPPKGTGPAKYTPKPKGVAPTRRSNRLSGLPVIDD